MKTKLLKILMTVLFMMGSTWGIAQHSPDASTIIKRIVNTLCANGNFEADKIMKVGDFSDAFDIMVRICPHKEIQSEKKNGYVTYTYVLPEGKGMLVFSDKCNVSKKEVAVLEVNVPELKGKVERVMFKKQ